MKVLPKLLLTLLTVALLAPAASAHVGDVPGKSYHVDQWKARYEVQENGDVQVTEELTVRFNDTYSFWGRTIPINRFDAISGISIYDETEGRELLPGEFDLTRTTFEGFAAADILIHFAATDEEKRWTITYLAEGAVGFFEDHDEFYWNVVPHDRDVPIYGIDATVVLPDDVGADNVRTTYYEDGATGVTQEAVDGRTARFSAELSQPGTDFTIVVGWPTGIVDNPGIVRVESEGLGGSGADVLIDGDETGLVTPVGLRGDLELSLDAQHAIQVRNYGITSEPTYVTVKPGEVQVVKLAVFDTPFKIFLAVVVVGAIVLYALLPLWVTLVLWLRWRKTGRDPKGDGTIVAQFEPPPPGNRDPDKADQPGVVGTLVDERADLRDLTASIIDLAVRGYLVIEEIKKPHSWSTQDYKLIKKKSWEGDSSLRGYEQELLTAVFGGTTERTLSDLKNKFYVKAPPIQDKLYDEVVGRGYFLVSPEKRRKKFYGAGTLIAILGFVITTSFFGAGIPLLVTGIVVIMFGRAAPQRTKEGVLAKEHALGFKEYLYRAERYVVKKMTPETFERFLPYAMVFQVEKEWAEKFKNIYVDREPSWYHSASGAHFNSLLLANAMSNWSAASTTTLASRPSSSGSGGSFSSGSSGFGGGGFSGGGGGGGGMRAG